MTILAHYWPYEIPYMWYGVRIFFSLSGFLITTILINSFRSVDSKFSVYKNFFIRRVLRLLPIYYLFILFFLLADLCNILLCWDFNSTAYFFTYTSNIYFYKIGGLRFGGWFSHLWTLSVEEQFYVVWPLIVMIFYSRGLLTVMVTLSLFSIYFLTYTGLDSDSILLWSNLHYLCVGGMLGLIHLDYSKTKAFLMKYKVELLVVLTVFLIPSLFYFESLVYREFCVVGFIFCLLNQSVFGWDGLIGAFFKSMKIQEIGIISYGIYLFHMPVPSLVRILAGRVLNSPLNKWIEIMLSVLITYYLARLSFKLVEKPFLRLKDRFQ